MMYSLGKSVAVTLAVWLLAGGGAGFADDIERIRRQLERLDKEIADSRAFPGATATSLEELRKDLYHAAVSTRDAKKRSDEVQRLLAEGQDAAAELEQLRGDIVSAGVLLRGLRDRMDQLERIVKNNERLLEDQASELGKLGKRLDQKPAEIEELIAGRTKSLQKEVDALNKKLADRDGEIQRLEQKLAARELRPAAVAIPGAGTAETAEGFDLLAAGQVDQAMERFLRAATLDPAAVDPRVGLAACHFERNEIQPAWNIIQTVLEADPRNARALGVKGALLIREGKMKDARKALERAIKIDPANPYFYNHLGVALHESGRSDDALEQLRKAVELDAGYVAAVYNLSVVLATAREPDLETSRYYYQRALSLGSPREPLMDQLLGLP